MKYGKFLLLPLLYALALLQSSFLVHFNLFGMVPNLIVVLIAAWSFLEMEKKLFSAALFCAVAGGFFLDIFSSRPFGFYIVMLVAIALFIKFFVRQYVRNPFRERI